MTKQVQSGSVEGGVREAFRTLGMLNTIAAIELHTGQRKSESLMRKYGDPDEPKHEISLRAAIAIDAAFVSEGLPPPFQRIFAQTLELWAAEPDCNQQLSFAHLTLAIDAASGLVAEAVLLAETLQIKDGDREGRNTVSGDHEDILYRLQKLDEATSALRKAIAVADRARTRADGAAMQEDISQPRANGASMR